MSSQPEHAQDAQDDARSYSDPHTDAETSLRGTAGPEDTDPVDHMATEVREPEEADENRPTEWTSGDGR